MSNDELVARIDADVDSWWGYGSTNANALRAVVELHKPEGVTAHTAGGREWIECSCECEYPCATIRAIEKELR